MLISCITATIGRIELIRNLRSLNSQIYKDYQHLIIVDGKEHEQKVIGIIDIFEKEGGDTSKIDLVVLPYPKKDFGGPIYSIGPAISKGQYIFNLDDDNWIENNHITSLLDTIETGCSWAYSLRNISSNNRIICQDNCESLGYLAPIWDLPPVRHIDTSAIFLPRRLALEQAPYWSLDEKKSIINDRLFYTELKTKYPNYECSMEYTLNYEVDNNQALYFVVGNDIMIKTYKKEKHWIK